METIDLTGLSSSDDRSVARESVPREKPLPSEPRGLVDLTIPDDEEDEKTRQQATFLLETAAQAPFSRSPSSAARVPSPAKAAELNGKARTEQQTPLRLRLRHSNGTPPFRSPSNGTPRMARKEAVRSRLSGRNVHHEPLAQSEEPKPNPRSPISGQSSPLRSVTTTTGPLDSSLSRIAIQRERPELSLRNCEDIVRRHLRDMRDDHATTLRVRISLDPVEGDAHSLSKSRLESARLSLAQSRDRAVGRSQYEAGSSPFASMPAISLTGTKAPAKNPRSVGVLVVSRSKHQHQYLVTSRTMYEEPIKTIPPVSSYVSLNKNVLTKDDKLLVYYPWSGDEINSNIDAAIKDLEEKIDVRKEKFSSACTVDEKAHIWAPYAGGILSQFDCDWDAIKAYQLIPVAERKEFDKRLLHKGRVSSSSIEYFDRPQIAAAGVINRAFANVTGTSLWQTFKGHLKDDTQRLELEKAPSEGPHSLVPYAKLQCLVCGMYVFYGWANLIGTDDQAGTIAQSMESSRKSAVSCVGSGSTTARLCQQAGKIPQPLTKGVPIPGNIEAWRRTARSLGVSGPDCGNATKASKRSRLVPSAASGSRRTACLLLRNGRRQNAEFSIVYGLGIRTICAGHACWRKPGFSNGRASR